MIFIAGMMLLLLCGVDGVNAADRYCAATGVWSATSTWSTTSAGTGGASVPTSSDAVYIERTRTVTVDITNAECASLTLGRITGTTAGTGTLTFAASGSPALTVSGAVQVGGTSNISSNGVITFTSGSSMTVGSLTMGTTARTSASTITMTAGGSLTINGALAVAGTGTKTWTRGTGTVIMNGTKTLPATIFTNFNNLKISAGTTTLGVAIPIVSGALNVNAGAALALSSYAMGATTKPTSLTMYCGATTGSSITGSGTLSLGGNVTVNSAGTGTNGATISAPIALIAARIFTVANDGTSAVDLTLSGIVGGAYSVTKEGAGTMVLSASNTYTGTTTISAGILKLGATGGTTYTPLGTAGNGTSVTSGAALDLGGYTLGTAEALTLNGTGISSGGALMSSGTAATYNGGITLGSASSIGTTGNITLGGNGITGAQNLTKTGTGTLSLGSGTATLDSLTINEGTLTATSGTMNLTGNFTNKAIFTHNSGTVSLNGSSEQTIGGTLSTTFNNLTINNSAGALLDIGETINGTLTLTSGRLILGTYNLTMGPSSPAVAGTLNASNMIVADGAGVLQKTFTANGSYIFPVGDVTGTAEYSPLTLNFASGTYSGAYAGVRVTNAKHPNNASATNYLNRYWTVSSSGISSFSCTVTGTYVTADIAGTEGSQAAGKYSGALPWTKYSTLGSNRLTANGVTSFGAFTGITAASPTVGITADPGLTVSINTSLTLTANPVGDPTFTYSWSPGGATSQAINPLTSAPDTTDYTVIVTDGNGFKDTTTVTVTVVFLIRVTATSGTTSGNYSSLKEAFDKINDGTHKGVISVKVNGSAVETAISALNASGSGSGAASYTSVLLYPTSSGLTISGSLNSELVNLNGADNITLDGRVNATGSTADLIFTNTSTGINAATLRLDSSAQSNNIQYCTIKGGGGSSSNGTILFGTTGSNINNTIANNNITNNGIGRINAIYSVTGTNTGNTISNNNLYDNWSADATSYSINLGTGASNWTILGNSIYRVGSLTPTGAYNYYGINISNTSGSNFTLTGNYIGGQSAQCGGSALTMGSTSISSTLYPIYLNVGTGSATSVQGNTIGKINFSSSSTTPFYGLFVNAGAVNIGNATGNAIGDTTGTGSLTLTSGSAATSYGIYVASTGTVVVAKSRIGSITLNTNTNAHGFVGINKSAVSGQVNISNNTIGSIGTSGTIVATTASTSIQQNVVGIQIAGTGTNTVNGNVVANLLNNSSHANSYVYGIGCIGSGTNNLSGNFIYNLNLNSTVTTNVLAGIYTSSGTNTVANNVISLGGNIPTGLYLINGLYSNGGTTDYFYHNTVYISGTITGSTAVHTSAFSKNSGGTVTVKNNIFVNARSGGSGTGKHSAISINSNTSFTSDFNVLYAPNTNGVAGALNTTPYATLTDWQSATSGDANSMDINPTLSNAGGGSATYYNPTVDLFGTDLTAIVPLDFSGTTRSTSPTIGAWEREAILTVEVYNGAVLLQKYPNLKGAFDKINKGSHTGSLIVKLTANTSETLPAKLNASGTTSEGGTSNFTDVLIYPTLSGLKVSGSLNKALINLNGADNVTIDGRVNATGSTADLEFANNQTGSNAVTIKLDSTAQSNTIQYCIIKGGGGSSANGTIFFGIAGSNLSNTISYCNITNNGTRRANAIYSVTGTNTGNTVINNNFFDTWSASDNSSSINLSTGTSGWTVTGNSFYATTSYTSGAFNYYGINISNTSGNNFTISGNYIGGQSSQCGGSAFTIGTAGSTLYPIYLSAGTATASSIQENTITNIAYTSSGATPFYGIYIANGAANIGTVSGNAIGDTTGTASITLTATSATPVSYGIFVAGTGTVTISNNIIGSITAANSTAANAHTFYGIYKANVAGDLTVSANTIGSVLTASNIRTSSTATGNAQSLYGIYSQGTGTILINGNTVANLSNSTTNTTATTRGSVNGIVTTAGTETITDNTVRNLTIANANNASDNTASVIGIVLTGTTLKTVTGNTIFGLSNTYGTFAGSIIGLYFSGGIASTNTVSRNFINRLTVPATTSSMYGIKINAGATTYSNNIIGLTNTAAATIYGIYETGDAGNNNDLYFNTVYIYGTLASGTSKTYALFSAVSSNTRIFKNNLLSNVRSTTNGTNLHYAIYYAASGTQSTITANYNDYIASGTGGVIGYYNGANKTTFVVVTGQDANSKNTAPAFLNASGTFIATTDFKTDLTIAGVSGTGITTDFNFETRSNTAPTIGAWEYFVNIDVYSGTTLVASFKTLQLAFNAINNGTNSCTGALTLKINTRTIETGTAVLNASGGSASYTRVHIYPTNVGLSITGNLNLPLINLNGADNVYFDGRVNGEGSTPSLLISNSYVGTTATTIQFILSAQNDTIQYCTLKGAGTGAGLGIVTFSTATTGTGNDNNIISNCNITGISASTGQTNAIYSLGTSGSENSGNLISNNKIYDTWLTSVSSYFVNLGANTTEWNISGNSFYETTSLQPAGGYTYSAVYLNNTSGNNHVVSGNYIGGQDTLCGGSPMLLGTAGTVRALIFYPIYINVGATTATSVQGNIIRNISYRSSATAPFSGIYAIAGALNIGTTSGNFVGDSIGTGSLTLASTTTEPVSYGIYLGSTGNLVVSNNMIGSVTTTNSTAANSHSFNGIYKASQAGTVTFSGNKIGSNSTANSVQISSAATGYSQLLFGINSAGTGNVLISSNTIANLSNLTTETTLSSKLYGIYTTAGTNLIQDNIVHDLTAGGSASSANYENVTMVGIYQYSMTAAQKIIGNTVYNLTSTTTDAVEFYGILNWGSTNGNDTIARNFVYGFKMISTSTVCYLHGLSFFNRAGTFTGTTTVINNVVFLGDSITTGCYIFGIVKNSLKAMNFFHNTIHLGGTVGDGSPTSSYAFRDKSDGTPAMRDIRNNIFYNTRSGGGSNYAIYFHVLGNIAIDYNDYGWSGTYFAQIYTPTNQFVTLQQWLQIMVGQDTHSLIYDPQFVKIDGILATDYKTNLGLDGIPGTGITTDFAGLTRSTGNPTMGAWECFPVDVYNGSTFRSSYFTLKDAFSAINNGTWNNNLIVKMKGSTLETATAVLNASGSGSADYSSVVVYPIRSDVFIKGDLAANLIQLNGADNVTFDGRIDTIGMTADMTISNLNTGTSAGTIQFIESAQNNTLYYCNIRGAGTGGTLGAVNFSTASSGTGNGGNLIKKCIITGTTLANRPVNAIYSSGTTGNENSGNLITENAIINNWRTESSSYSINLGPGTTNWTISTNNFYDTTTFVPTGANTYSAIYLNNSSGVNHSISGNYIGGRMAQCLGSALTIGSTSQASVFYPIYLNVGTSTASSIQGNLITNLTCSSSATNPFAGIYVAGGSVNVGTTLANNIGAVTGNGAVTITASAAGALSYGMYLGGSDTLVVSGNNIGSVTAANSTPANAHGFYGIITAGSGSITLSSNLIGSTSTAGSIQTSSVASGNAQMLCAIYSNGTGTDLIKENTITNLSNSSTYNVAGNHISGINHAGTGTATILQNYISNLNSAYAAGTANVIAGIYLNNGFSNCANNVLNLGSNSLGYHLLYGLYETGVSSFTNSIYHNTVYLSGTVNGTTSAALTYAFYKQNDIGTSNIKNNIFFNARTSGSSSSKHYAIRLPGVTTLYINGNDYWITGTYGVLGRMNATDMTTLALWKTATSQDTYSVSSTPGFLNAGGSSALDYKIGAVLSGVSGTGITIDFGGNSRDISSPTMGAWEYSLCVEVYNGATLRGAYSTLKGAFDKINDGTWTGDLTIKIYKSTYETATAALNASGSGPTIYSKVHVFPVRDSVTVAGSMNAPLVNLNGADYVILDGRVEAAGSTPSITFSNTSTGTGAATIQFSESAQNDTLKYCYIKGAGLGATIGAINFSTASTGTGNSGNIITHCMISGQNSSERPVNAIYSAGTSGRENSGIIISNNNIYNCLVTGTASNAIQIGSNSTGFTITDNSFYGTAILTATAAVEYAMIRINNTSGNSFTITNNYIGGNAPLCSGTWTKVGNNNTFYGIYLNVGSSSATSVQNNLITNISYTNTGSANLTGIHVAAGLVNIGTVTANTIGAATGTGSFNIINGATGGNVYAINISGTNTVSCQNNIIGSITPTNSTQAYATNFYGIYKGAVAGNVTISNNTIGSTTTTNSIQATSNAYDYSQLMYGIYSAGTGMTIISGNTLANMSNLTVETTMSSKMIGIYVSAGANNIQNNTVRDLKNGGSASGGSDASAPNFGIYTVSTTAGQIISDNSVYRLINTSTAKIYVYGIYYSGPTSGTNAIYKNFVNRMILPVAPPESYIQGMTIMGGTGSVYNNIVAIGDSITKGCTLYGMMINNTSAMTIYHNTVYIGGTVAAAVSPTYAFRDETATPSGARNIRNNIFSNHRSGGGTHYAIYLGSSSALTINYNDYYAGGTNGVLGYLTSARTTLAAWRTATGQDANSINTNPLFVYVGSTSPTDYTPTASLSGVTGLGITTDYSGTTRQSPPTIGALEFMGYYWTGNLDTDWNKSGNWLPQIVPIISVHANIPYRSNQPDINSGIAAEVKSMLIYSGAIVTINGGGSLTIASNLVNNAGTTGLVVNSTADGTGSFIYDGDNVSATVKRYIDGDSAAWHFLSTPVSGQAILGTSWTPSGNYGDGTGYDLYIWDEPTSCWIYNLNTTVSPTWPSVHPQNNFIPGRGYLYALLDSIPTKQFVGTLNNGAINQSLSILSDTVDHRGFNFIGNPYPSSIDWKTDAGFVRTMLNLNGGGYDFWTWSSTASNYGVFNSADTDDDGTNNISRYIAPMQGFFVYATSAGSFGFNNGARVHTGASSWLKSSPAGAIGAVKLSVSSDAGKGSDEIKLGFGYTSNSNGALKMFSHVKTAPSLYIPSENKKLTILHLTNTEDNPKTAVSFKAGVDGLYTIKCLYDPSITGVVYLEDLQTGEIHDFSTSETYSFSAKTSDASNRFVLHYGSVTPTGSKIDADVFVSSGNLIVDISKLSGEYPVQIFDVSGRIICSESINNSVQFSYPLKSRGLYIVTIRSDTTKSDFKVMY